MKKKLKDVVSPKILAIAKRVGVRFYLRSMKDNYAWNGRTIAVLHSGGRKRTDSDLIHDIAHYLLSTASRRRQPEFGLGQNPDNECKIPMQLLSTADAQKEEELVSILGILIEKQLGLMWRDTWMRHNWSYDNGCPRDCINEFMSGDRSKAAHKTLAKLLKRRKINKECVPTCL